MPYTESTEDLGENGTRAIVLHSCGALADVMRWELVGYDGQWFWREDFGNEVAITFCPWCAAALPAKEPRP